MDLIETYDRPSLSVTNMPLLVGITQALLRECIYEIVY